MRTSSVLCRRGQRLSHITVDIPARTVSAFDDIVTGPLHGFSSADDYWRRASSKHWLSAIRLPANALPRPDQVSRDVRLEFSRDGGHVGFVTGSLPGKLD